MLNFELRHPKARNATEFYRKEVKYQIAAEYKSKIILHMKIDELAPQALQLSTKDRALLAASLWESIEDPYDLDVQRSDENAIAVALTRDAELESGRVKAISHQELMASLRR